jgi:hypothetical protein
MLIAFQASDTHSPPMGDRFGVGAQGFWPSISSFQRYTLTAMREVEARHFVCSPARYIPPNG